jgi:hypothetical protein
MPLTVEQIVSETNDWPPEKIAELHDRLGEKLHGPTDPAVDAAWREEIRRRLDAIENGKVELIPGDVVMAKARKIVGL